MWIYSEFNLRDWTFFLKFHFHTEEEKHNNIFQ